MRELFSARKKRASITVGLFLTSLAALLASPLPSAIAQSQTPAPKEAVAQSAQPTISNTKPDVQIVVFGLPTGTYAVSSVYPKQVPKAVAQGRIDKLLALTKWQAKSRKFSDAPAVPNPLRDETTPKGQLSAASFETTGAIYGSDGAIDWEPFLRAFGDVNRINIVCFTGPEFAYSGPVAFDSERVTFSASGGQGTVAVVANIKKPEPSPALFGLPKYRQADAVVAQAQVPAKKSNGTNRVVGVILVALAATGIALVIYALTSRFVTKP
jgi:hypothetical protein